MFFYSNTNSQGQTEVLCKCKVAGLVDGLRMPLYGCYLNFYGNYRAKKTRVLRRACFGYSSSLGVFPFRDPFGVPCWVGSCVGDPLVVGGAWSMWRDRIVLV